METNVSTLCPVEWSFGNIRRFATSTLIVISWPLSGGCGFLDALRGPEPEPVGPVVDAAESVIGKAVVAGIRRQPAGYPDYSGGDTLGPWEVFLFAASPTDPWELHSTALVANVRNDSRLALASRPSGELLLADITDSGSGRSATVFNPGTGLWTSLDDALVADEMFQGQSPLGAPFTLVGRGTGYCLLFVNGFGAIRSSHALDAEGPWEDGGFPSTVSPTAAMNGIGGAAGDLGLVHLALASNAAELFLTWGAGPASWEDSEVLGLPVPTASAPSVAKLGGGIWLFTFRTPNNTLEVYGVDTGSAATTIVGPFTPAAGLTSQVFGQPQIATNESNVVLAWRTGSSGTDLVVVRGTADGAGATLVTWGDPVVLDQGTARDPVAAHL